MSNLHTEIRFSFCFLLLAFILLLSACVTGGGYKPQQSWPQQKGPAAAESPNDITMVDPVKPAEVAAAEVLEGSAPVKVAILLPLSGQNANLGESMQRAAEMALFDVGQTSFELMPRDTKGTAEGAAAAARDAIKDGAKLIIGPVFANEVKSAQRVTQAAGVNMIAFSTDWTLANNKTYLIGFLPFDQVERIIRYSVASGYKRIGVLSPSDTYGNAVVSAFQGISNSAGVMSARVERLPQIGTQYPAKIKAFSDFDKRQVNGQGSPYDAILLPLGGNSAKQVSTLLTQDGLPSSTVKRLGTGLMDDPALAQDASLDGSWFAAPSPQSRRKFEQRYGNTFGIKPMRLSSLAYDATALAAVLARNAQSLGQTATFDHASITNPNGFAGVDGIFRFRQDGISERGLAVLEYRNGSIVVVDDSPSTFQNSGL